MRIWQNNASEATTPFEATASSLRFLDEMEGLSPQSQRQRLLHGQSMNIVDEIAKTRLLLFTNSGRSIPMAFLVVLIIREPRRGGLDHPDSVGSTPSGFGQTIAMFFSRPSLPTGRGSPTRADAGDPGSL